MRTAFTWEGQFTVCSVSDLETDIKICSLPTRFPLMSWNITRKSIRILKYPISRKDKHFVKQFGGDNMKDICEYGLVKKEELGFQPWKSYDADIHYEMEKKLDLKKLEPFFIVSHYPEKIWSEKSSRPFQWV